MRECVREAAGWLCECAVMVSLIVLAVCGGLISTAHTAELSRTAVYGAVSALIWAVVFATAAWRMEREDVYIARWTEK